MAQEIERKFLVSGDFKSEAAKATRITQGYLSSVPERTVRVRIKEKDLPQALTLIDESTTTFVTDSFVGESTRVVLIPVDFSEYSIKTCHIGFKFAKEHNCGVVILHSYISQYFSGTLPLGETLRAEKKMLEYMKEKGRKANETMRQFKSEIYKNIEAGELPDVPRRAGVRALRRGGICAVRRVSAVGRAHGSRNGERQCGTARVPHRRNLRLRRAAERIRHGGRRRQGVSAHFTYRAIGGVS